MLYRSRARIDIGRLQPASALIGDIIESVIDVTGTYLLVNGKWGLPKMGVVSGAIAYMVSAITIATAYNLRSYYHPVYQHYQLYHFSWQEFKKCFYSPEFKILLWGGLHIAFKFSIVNITFILTTQLCRLSGSAALIGLQAAGAYAYVVSLPIGGFSEATSVLIGQLFKNNWNDARKIGHFTILIGCFFSCLCAAALFIFINPIAKIFMDDKAHAKDFQTVKTFLRIQAIMEIVNSMGNTGASVLSGCLETRYPFLLSLLFIFILNSMLATSVFFAFDRNPMMMYAVQLVGFTLVSSGVLRHWKKQAENQIHSFFSPPKQSESPRHPAGNDPLPIENHNQLMHTI